MKLIGAAYLLYLPFMHFSNPAEGDSRREPPRATPWLGMTAFWGTVVKVELTNLVFSIDSILAAVAMSTKTWVVLTGGILGIVAMRMVVGQVMTLVERYPAIVDGAFIIIAWVGVKLLIEYLHTEGWVPFAIPQWMSLSIIVLIFTIAFLYARRHPSAKGKRRDRVRVNVSFSLSASATRGARAYQERACAEGLRGRCARGGEFHALPPEWAVWCR